MEKLKELILLCEGSVTINVNPHKDYYEDVKSHIT